MKISNKFFSRLLVIAFSITTIIWIQQIKTMECVSVVEEVQNTSITYNNPDFHLHMLLSSVAYESPFWLPADIIRSITTNAHNVTELLFDINLDCSTISKLLAATWKLNSLYCSCPNMPAALLKIYLNNHKASLLEIKDDNSWFTVFDFTYGPGSFEPEVKTLCLVVDKKAFVDHFKEPFDPFGCIDIGYSVKTNLLHRLMWYNSNAEIIKLYCGVFMDYAKDCPKKSKEILKLLRAKDDDGAIVLDITKEKGFVEIAAILKNTEKELRLDMQKKENCLIQ